MGNDNDKEKGIYDKYRVFKAENDEPVTGFFVLRPEKDPAARLALQVYAESTENEQLSIDIYDWLQELPELAGESDWDE